MNIKKLVIVLLITALLLAIPCAYAAPNYNNDIVKNAFDSAKSTSNQGNIFGDGGLVPSLFTDKNVENNIIKLVKSSDKNKNIKNTRESESLEGFLKFFLNIN